MGIEYELFPGMNTISTPAVASQKDYEQFRLNFQKSIDPIIKENARKRATSEITARFHWIN